MTVGEIVAFLIGSFLAEAIARGRRPSAVPLLAGPQAPPAKKKAPALPDLWAWRRSLN